MLCLAEKVPLSLTPDEIDTIRCAINRLIRVGPHLAGVSDEVWPIYKLRLQQIREMIRVGPPDERSSGL